MIEPKVEGATTTLITQQQDDVEHRMARFVGGDEARLTYIPNSIEPFSAHCITDHIPVVGAALAVYSGADADGIGNKAKKFADKGKGINLRPSDQLKDLEKIDILMKDMTEWAKTAKKTYETHMNNHLTHIAGNCSTKPDANTELIPKLFSSMCTTIQHTTQCVLFDS